MAKKTSKKGILENISVKLEILTTEDLRSAKGIRVNPFEGDSCEKCNATKLEGTLEERRCLTCGNQWKV